MGFRLKYLNIHLFREPLKLSTCALGSVYVMCVDRARCFYEGDYESCYLISKRVLEDDHYHLATLPVHIASLATTAAFTEGTYRIFYCHS